MASMMAARITLYRRDGTPLGDLTEIVSCEMIEEVNGAHTLTIETPVHLEVGTYALMRGPDGKLREYCVNEPDERHERGYVAIGTYVLPWSLYADLMGTDGSELWASAEVGTLEPIPARQALTIALSDQTRWTVGTVDVDTVGACSLYDDQTWNYLCKLVETFGGEVDAEIVADGTGVIERRVALRRHIGREDAIRRFDWGHDLTSIRRTPAEGPYFCGIRPRGGQAKTDADGVDYTERVGIEDEPECLSPDGWYHPANSPYLIDRESEMAFRVQNPDGTWEYPMRVVTYDVTQTSSGPDAEELLTKASAEIFDYTRPKVTYEADVLALVDAGMDVDGISLGDEVQCVDRGFNEDAPLRIEGRVMRIECDPRAWRQTMRVTIGSLGPTLAQTIRGLAKGTLATVERRIATVEGEAARFRNVDVDRLVADMAQIETLYVTGLDVDEAIIGKLSATYAKVDATNIDTAQIREAWVDRLLVQTGLIAHEGTVFTLDAVQVNAVNITAGTIDVERLVVTVDGQKYMVHVDPSTGATSYAKLDGNIIQDLTITTDKLVAGAVTTEKITTENIVGTGGWINLRTGRFAYMNATTGNGIIWDGEKLTIAGSVLVGGTEVGISEIAQMAKNSSDAAAQALRIAEDMPNLVLTSSHGTVFKQNVGTSTTLIATIFCGDGTRITGLAALRARYGDTARLQWRWKDMGMADFGTLIATDPRIGAGGFTLTISPEDISTQAVIDCELII